MKTQAADFAAKRKAAAEARAKQQEEMAKKRDEEKKRVDEARQKREVSACFQLGIFLSLCACEYVSLSAFLCAGVGVVVLSVFCVCVCPCAVDRKGCRAIAYSYVCLHSSSCSPCQAERAKMGASPQQREALQQALSALASKLHSSCV